MDQLPKVDIIFEQIEANHEYDFWRLIGRIPQDIVSLRRRLKSAIDVRTLTQHIVLPDSRSTKVDIESTGEGHLNLTVTDIDDAGEKQVTTIIFEAESLTVQRDSGDVIDIQPGLDGVQVDHFVFSSLQVALSQTSLPSGNDQAT